MIAPTTPVLLLSGLQILFIDCANAVIIDWQTFQQHIAFFSKGIASQQEYHQSQQFG
jgi:hypothetical protein